MKSFNIIENLFSLPMCRQG